MRGFDIVRYNIWFILYTFSPLIITKKSSMSFYIHFAILQVAFVFQRELH